MSLCVSATWGPPSLEPVASSVHGGHVVNERRVQQGSEALEVQGLHPPGAAVALPAVHLELDAVFKPRVAK